MKKNKEERRENKIPNIIPILPTFSLVLYPGMIVPLHVEEPNLVKLIDETIVSEKIVGIVLAKEKEVKSPSLYSVGTAANIVKMLKIPDGSVQILIQGISRIKILKYTQTEPYFKAKVEEVKEIEEESLELKGLVSNLTSLFQKIISLSPHIPEEFAQFAFANLPKEGGKLADLIAANLNLSIEERQQILEEFNVLERLKKVTYFVNREIEILEVGNKIQSQIKSQFDKTQREFFLREQLKALQKELGEMDEQTQEIEEIKKKLDSINLSEEARKEAERELERLKRMPPHAPEYTVSRTYLDWIISLPWDKTTVDNLDIKEAEKILDEDHYNLEKVKKRIIEYLAVRKLKNDTKGPILCFVGPPGVGKTSLGRSIARALGRKFVRMSLGGVRDEAEIRGHRRTYVGALPGRIIQEIRRAGTSNPVFMLDEIDKVGSDFRGDPSSALLEVLDPEQNNSFLDHYLDVPYDLSKVMFITTANLIHPILPALRDRMEIIEIPGYTEKEKLEIAKRYLIPRQIKEHGLKEEDIKITDEAINHIIKAYTREAGIRNLEREISAICRGIAKKVATGEIEKKEIDKDDLKEFLGVEKYRYELANEKDEIGVATGLAWTEVGGDVLFVEAILVPGKGNIILTGHLGDVMQESAKAAVTYARSKEIVKGVKINPDVFLTKDIHIHVPSGAIPKDGPSAGVTMATSLISTLIGRPVKKEIAMTGEITLRGKVLPVGGIKEKVLAAHRAGIKTVILPKENEKDLEEVPEIAKENLKFVFVENVDEILEIAIS